jgi:hypothetical protein
VQSILLLISRLHSTTGAFNISLYNRPNLVTTVSLKLIFFSLFIIAFFDDFFIVVMGQFKKHFNHQEIALEFTKH